jgi:acetyl-CoA C-acetyltransferase
LIVPIDGTSKDHFPRRDTSLEKLAKLQPVFDRTSGRGTLTAGNSSPLTDGAAAIWVATERHGSVAKKFATRAFGRFRDGRCRYLY